MFAETSNFLDRFLTVVLRSGRYSINTWRNGHILLCARAVGEWHHGAGGGGLERMAGSAKCFKCLAFYIYTTNGAVLPQTYLRHPQRPSCTENHAGYVPFQTCGECSRPHFRCHNRSAYCSPRLPACSQASLPRTCTSIISPWRSGDNPRPSG